MGTTFIVIQLALNVVLVVGFALLLRERMASHRRAEQREGRLAALAAEVCDVGQDLVRRGSLPEVTSSPAGESDTTSEARPAETAARATTSVPAVRETPDRVEGAVSMLARGMSLERVAAETALPPGEVKLLRNLARAAKPSEAPARQRRGTSPGLRSPRCDGRVTSRTKGKTALVERHGNA